jgi:hypothetical protein
MATGFPGVEPGPALRTVGAAHRTRLDRGRAEAADVRFTAIGDMNGTTIKTTVSSAYADPATAAAVSR